MIQSSFQLYLEIDKQDLDLLTFLGLSMCFILGLAVNHHLDEMDVVQFEHFYYEKMQDADIFSSEMAESTTNNKRLNLTERLERLRDDDALEFTSNGSFWQLYWLGKRAMYLELRSKNQDKYIGLIGALVRRMQEIFGDRIIVIYNQGTCPTAWILELVVEGMGIEDILNHLDERYAIRLTKINHCEIGKMRREIDCGLVEYTEHQA